MGRRLNYKSIAFAAMVATLVLSMCSLIFLGTSESAARDNPLPQRLFISGTYTTDGDAVARPLPSDGDFGFSNEKISITVEGHFNREVPRGEIISLRLDNLHLHLYIHGALAYEYGEPYSTLPYVRSTGNGWQYFASPGIGMEQTVRLELTNLYTNHTNTVYRIFFGELYSGNPATHIARDLQSTLAQSIMAIFIIIMGILELGYALALAYAKTNANEYFTLAGMSITYGVWFLINFETLGLFSPNSILNNSLQHLSLSLSLCYALLYTATQLSGQRRTCVRATAVAAIFMTVSSILCQHLGVLDYYDFTLPLYLLLGISILEMMVVLCLEYRARPKNHTRRKLHPLCLLLFGALADLLLSYFEVLSFVVFEVIFCIFTFCQLYFVLRAAIESAGDKLNIRLLQEDHERQQRLLEYQTLLTRATKGLYESIYELDLTHNCAVGEPTRKYFESLGIPADTPYNQALEHIAEMQIHPEYRQGYVETFKPKNVLEQYKQGVDTLQYDFLISRDGENYYWMRIDARVFLWKEDNSVRMIVYRQNVDEEKRQELELMNRADQDSLTGLLNREAMERQANALLENKPTSCGICCVILDIDDFKDVNDTFGHMAGDFVLKQLAVLLCAQFPAQDIIGRLGGDEFLVVAPCSHIDEVRTQIDALLQSLSSAHTQFEGRLLPLTLSVGVAHLSGGGSTFEAMYRRADEALYQSKREGKKRCTIHQMEGHKG